MSIKGTGLATNSGKSAIRRELDQVNEQQRLQPITKEELAELGEAALWYIAVEPYIPRKRGLIERPPSVDLAERIIATVGRVVQIGEFAYQSRTVAGLELSHAKVRAQEGDYWLFQMYAGQEVHLRSGHVLRLVTDTEIIYRVKNPDLIKGYAE